MAIKKRNRVVNILMKRDGITEREVGQLIQQTLHDIDCGNYEAIQDNLMLEDDYIFDLLDYQDEHATNVR